MGSRSSRVAGVKGCTVTAFEDARRLTLWGRVESAVLERCTTALLRPGKPGCETLLVLSLRPGQFENADLAVLHVPANMPPMERLQFETILQVPCRDFLFCVASLLCSGDRSVPCSALQLRVPCLPTAMASQKSCLPTSSLAPRSRRTDSARFRCWLAACGLPRVMRPWEHCHC